MKTREEIQEEIQQEFVKKHEEIWDRFHQKQAELVMERDRAWTRSREEYIAKKDAALAELDDPMLRLTDMLALLQRLEWSVWNQTLVKMQCPTCFGLEPTHHDTCALDAAIKKAKGQQ